MSVTFSVPTLDDEVWRTTEPGTAPPRQRLRALRVLVDAGVRASVGMAPLLPGLSDHPSQIERVVAAAREAGACGIWANLLYLKPGTREHFLDVPRTRLAGAAARLRAPLRAARVPAAADAAPAREVVAEARPRARDPRPPAGTAATAAESRTAVSPLLPRLESPAMADEITTLIVDDHEVVREGLRLSLSRAPHIRVVGEAADGASAVEMAERRKPDVVIMDVRMPGMDGLEATKLLTEKVPDSKVLIFTAYSERSLLSRGLESGAKGYILKEAPHQTLVRAIEKVAQGDGYVDPALMPAFLAGKDQTDMLTDARAGDPPAARRRHVERRRRRPALHLAGDREEPRPAHPHEARGRHAHARGRDRAPRSNHRLDGRPVDDGLDRLIAAEQDERRRIALFLHDGPVQNLSGIALMLDATMHAIQTGKLEDARERPRAPRSTGSARRSASCATCRSRSSPSSSATRASRRR